MTASLLDVPADEPGQVSVPTAGDSGSITLLRVLVKERHWQKYETFQAQLTRAARQLAKQEEEPWLAAVTVSARTWERWLTGNLKTEPRPDACRVLEHMFGYPVGDLLAPACDASVLRIREEAKQTTGAPPGNGSGGPVKDQARTIDALSPASPGGQPLEGTPVTGPARDGTWDVEDMERRELLRLLGSMAAVAPLAGGLNAETVRRNLDSALNAPTTKSDVAEWERVTALYSAESGKVPPALLLPELLTDLDEAQQRLHDAPESLRPPMARVCAYLSALAAISYQNAGDERNVSRYWRTALRLIDQSDDRPARASLYGYRAVFALDDGSSPATALPYAEDAISIADGMPCVGAARGHVARATALALLGDHAESLRTLRDLADTFTRLPAASAGAGGMLKYSEQELHFTHSRVYAYGGRASDAVKSWEAGRALIPDGLPLATAAFDLGRATGLMLDGDISEGARHVVRTIQALPPGFRQCAVARWKAARALDAAPAAAADTPAIKEARELLSLPSATGPPAAR